MLVALLAVLTVTGVALLWLYHPVSSAPWAWVRVVHAVASALVVWLALAYLIAVLVQRRHRWRWPHAVGLLVVLWLLSFTGYLLPWDQLALYAVTVGTNVRGALTAVSADVKFVLVGSTEISKGTYGSWLAVHTVLLPLVGLAGLWFVRRRVGSRAHAPDAGSPSLRRDDALARHGDPQPHA